MVSGTGVGEAMTDNTQELDEILERLRLWCATDNPKALRSLNNLEAKEALLDWHNKQIEEVLDRLLVKVRRAYDKEGDFLEMVVDTIKAERNKLKEAEL